ncbi:MAG: hypothetical protein AAF335_01060 [Bacteroidota bacterium]
MFIKIKNLRHTYRLLRYCLTAALVLSLVPLSSCAAASENDKIMEDLQKAKEAESRNESITYESLKSDWAKRAFQNKGKKIPAGTIIQKVPVRIKRLLTSNSFKPNSLSTVHSSIKKDKNASEIFKLLVRASGLESIGKRGGIPENVVHQNAQEIANIAASQKQSKRAEKILNYLKDKFGIVPTNPKRKTNKNQNDTKPKKPKKNETVTPLLVYNELLEAVMKGAKQEIDEEISIELSNRISQTIGVYKLAKYILDNFDTLAGKEPEKTLKVLEFLASNYRQSLGVIFESVMNKIADYIAVNTLRDFSTTIDKQALPGKLKVVQVFINKYRGQIKPVNLKKLKEKVEELQKIVAEMIYNKLLQLIRESMNNPGLTYTTKVTIDALTQQEIAANIKGLVDFASKKVNQDSIALLQFLQDQYGSSLSEQDLQKIEQAIIEFTIQQDREVKKVVPNWENLSKSHNIDFSSIKLTLEGAIRAIKLSQEGKTTPVKHLKKILEAQPSRWKSLIKEVLERKDATFQDRKETWGLLGFLIEKAKPKATSLKPKEIQQWLSLEKILQGIEKSAAHIVSKLLKIAPKYALSLSQQALNNQNWENLRKILALEDPDNKQPIVPPKDIKLTDKNLEGKVLQVIHDEHASLFEYIQQIIKGTDANKNIGKAVAQKIFNTTNAFEQWPALLKLLTDTIEPSEITITSHNISQDRLRLIFGNKTKAQEVKKVMHIVFKTQRKAAKDYVLQRFQKRTNKLADTDKEIFRFFTTPQYGEKELVKLEKNEVSEILQNPKKNILHDICRQILVPKLSKDMAIKTLRAAKDEILQNTLKEKLAKDLTTDEIIAEIVKEKAIDSNHFEDILITQLLTKDGKYIIELCKRKDIVYDIIKNNKASLNKVSSYVFPPNSAHVGSPFSYAHVDWQQVRWELIPEITKEEKPLLELEKIDIPADIAFKKLKASNFDSTYKKTINRIIRLSRDKFEKILRINFHNIKVQSLKPLQINWPDEDFSHTNWEQVRTLTQPDYGLIPSKELSKAILPGISVANSSHTLDKVIWNKVRWSVLPDFAEKSGTLDFSTEDLQIIAKKVFPDIVFTNEKANLENVTWKSIIHFKAANWLVDKGTISEEALRQIPKDLLEQKLKKIIKNTPEATFWEKVKTAQYASPSIIKPLLFISGTVFACAFLYLWKGRKVIEKLKKHRAKEVSSQKQSSETKVH